MKTQCDWYFGVVVSSGLGAGVPGLLLGVRDGFQVAGDRSAAEVEAMDTILWKHQDLDSLVGTLKMYGNVSSYVH